MDQQQKIIFFAYKGRYDGYADDNVDSIKYAIVNYNQHQKKYVAKSWEEFRQTTPISHEILEAIDSCEVFACDMTYFNHNVLFELGYAIAKDKFILILLNESIAGTKEKYQEFILKNIRYTPITNANSIQKALQQKNYQKDLLSKLVNPGNIQDKSIDIFYKQSKIANQASLELTEVINLFRSEKSCKVVSDDASEVGYKPLSWYFQNLVKSRIIIIHFLGKNVEGEFIENAENSFYAGIACGFGAEVLLVAPSKYKAPLDYHEILIQYREPTDLVETVWDWIDKRTELPPAVKAEKIVAEEHELNLIKLGIGCDIAEEEQEDLLHYFVPTSSYNAALTRQKSLLIGRKGSGKSAIYIKLLDEFSHDDLNFVISLRPESDELLEDVEMSALFNSNASKRSFFFTVWKFVIYSKLAVVIRERLADKPAYYQNSEAEKKLIDFVNHNESFIKLNFFGVVREISKRIRDTRQVNSADILQDLYNEYLTPLITTVKNYYRSVNTKYYKIVILADNLDKTWDSQHSLDVQSEMILTLLQLENKIKSDLIDRKETNVELQAIVFLRKDIFDYICKISIEPDKLTMVSHEINWEDYPGLLKELIENRFKYILDLSDQDEEVEIKAWKEFFDFKSKEREHPYKTIRQITKLRPRDLIYFMNRLFESAINNGHSKVDDKDLYYAINSYTNFLNNNLIAETKAEFPEIGEIITKLNGYGGEKLRYGKYRTIVKSFGYDSERIDDLTSTLFKNGYMMGFDEKTSQQFSDVETLRSKLKQKRFFILPNNKLYVIVHEKYYLIRGNKTCTLF
jgi:nucleoside 2-deoxyribosyltransferase